MVRKWLNWVLTSVTLTFDLWPWSFAWKSLLPLVISSWYDDGNIVNKAFRERQQTSALDQWMVVCSIVYRHCSNYIFILDVTSGFKGFGKDCRKTVWETFKCWDKVRLILETWRYISFIPSQSTSPFLKYGYWKIDLENPRPRSWVRSKFKVTTWVQHPIDSNPFGSMSIRRRIPMI